MEGVASCSHCVQYNRHVMWSMLTGNEVACTCLYMYLAGGVGTSTGMLCVCVCERVTSCRIVLGGLCAE